MQDQEQQDGSSQESIAAYIQAQPEYQQAMTRREELLAVVTELKGKLSRQDFSGLNGGKQGPAVQSVPPGIEAVCDAVFFLLEKRAAANWKKMRKVMGEPNFVSRVIDFDLSTGLHEPENATYLAALEKRVGSASFPSYDQVTRSSQPVACLCKWLRAVVADATSAAALEAVICRANAGKMDHGNA